LTAFAGVLLDVGKRLPELFSTVLAPLFFTWVIWEWDFQLATLHQSEREPPGFWGYQPVRLFTLAQRWHQLPHRSEALLTPNGLIARTMLGYKQFHAFFEKVRSAWKTTLQQEGENEETHLRIPIERLDPANYTFEQRGNETVPIDFKWPQAIARENEEDLRKLGRGRQLASCPGAAASSWTLASLYRRTSCNGFGISYKQLTRSRLSCRATRADRRSTWRMFFAAV
jgi:hypothetical protein